MSTERVQTKRDIQAILGAAGLRPRKRFGQHFLIDGNLMRRLVASAEVNPQDCVLEVGGGTGGLTDLLASRARKVICVEVDRDLQEILADRFADAGGVVLVGEDVLESKHRISSEVASLIQEYDRGPGAGAGAKGVVKLVANLPYQIATPLVMNLLLDYPMVRRLCFTIQAEVAERIIASPNSRAYGPLSIISQTLCSMDTVVRLPPEAFWPRPTVDSTMIRMDVQESPFDDRDQLRQFAVLVRKVFEHRRKKLRSALRHVVSDEVRNRVGEQVDTTRRPQSFSVEEWQQIGRLAAGE